MATTKGFTNELITRYIDQVVDAFSQLVDDIRGAILAPGANWQVLFLGIIFGQGPFQLWEAGILNALDRFKANLNQALTVAFQQSMVAVGMANFRSKFYSSRVLTADAAVTLLLNYVLVAGQNVQLFNASGLAALVNRLEHSVFSPLRKILAIVRGQAFMSFTKTAASVTIGTVTQILRAGGGLALILLAATIIDDVVNNPDKLLRLALQQNNPRAYDRCGVRRRTGDLTRSPATI